MNDVQLIGWSTHEPNLGRAGKGEKLATLRIAVPRHGEHEVDHVTVTVSAASADAVLAHLHRGCRVAIQGQLRQCQWQDTHGDDAVGLLVAAERVEFLDRPAPVSTEASVIREVADDPY